MATIGLSRRLREVGVDEVEIGLLPETFPCRIGGSFGDSGVPAHVGNLAAVLGEADDLAGKDPRPCTPGVSTLSSKRIW
jgi:hypothetical protein